MQAKLQFMFSFHSLRRNFILCDVLEMTFLLESSHIFSLTLRPRTLFKKF